MKKRIHALSVTATVFVLGPLVMVGEALANPAASSPGAICESCHGRNGVSSESAVPTIAGISAPVIEDALLDFKEGFRTCDKPDNAMTANMCAVAADLTDEQIQSFAEYFSAMEFKAAAQGFDAERAAAGARIHEEECERCHTSGGSDPNDDASILAGQWLPYLQANLARFVSGEREAQLPMQRRLEKLSEADRDALAHYYASQQQVASTFSED